MFKSFYIGSAGSWGGEGNASTNSGFMMTAPVSAQQAGSSDPASRSWLDLVRLSDIFIAACGFLVLSPLMLAIAIAICLTDRGPIFYRHERVGRNGKRFDCLKFRSMHVDSDRILSEYLAANPAAKAEWDTNRKLFKDPRVSTIGLILRKTSLDELPQLFNVLRGDMSVVGPRPVVDEELKSYGRYVSYYLSVRPGVTGLWQVSGRNHTTYRRRVACDVAYVRSQCLTKNLRIMILTVPVVLFGRGAY